MGDQENVTTMNFRLSQIETKLDKIEQLVTQTATQEYRIAELEKWRDRNDDKIWRFLTPVISSVISAVCAFVVAGGLK